MTWNYLRIGKRSTRRKKERRKGKFHTITYTDEERELSIWSRIREGKEKYHMRRRRKKNHMIACADR
jgi:hypothetical protein